MHSALKTVLALLTLWLPLSGCTQLAYYAQAAGGQLDLSARRQPVTHLLTREKTPAALKKKLALALKLKNFAETRLHLPEGDGFRSYADLERPFATWVVFATPPFSLTPQEWCFPITGCLAYRGYFNRETAETFAAGLRAEGKDVHVAGSPAYSTLGWFDDPLLNTFIHWPDAELAALMFHEMAHEKLYLGGDTVFNESYAEAVSRAGVARWLRLSGRDGEAEAFQRRLEQNDRFTAWVERTRTQLEKLYASGLARSEMSARKEKLLTRAGETLNGSDHAPFAQGLNNAKLASVNTYNHWVPAFLRLLEQQGGDMAAFHLEAARLAALPTKERHTRLEALTPGG